jgi:hypothetical protein
MRLDAFSDIVQHAARRLAASGAQVLYLQCAAALPWHVIARAGAKWRIIQVLPPGSDAAQRREGRQQLGATAMMSARLGTMEQWFAHVRPGGRLAFGTDLLSGYAWGGAADSPEALGDRLASLAKGAGAIMLPQRPVASVAEAGAR